MLVAAVGTLWAQEIVDQLAFGGGLDRWGVRPRELAGLRGIAFAPWLHGGFEHLAANTLPLLLLGGLVLRRSTFAFVLATLASALVGGLGAWLLGASGSVHIGASGLVFGYFGFLAGFAYVERSLGSVLVALGVAFVYGGMLWGVLPRSGDTSWQTHLFGLVGGLGAAKLWAGPGLRLRLPWRRGARRPRAEVRGVG
ncbi:MAG TPA: rhomboid family intramembrane serine protease [Polyangiaceae bacterium]|nr:rhomboid family intramembrane serine protease [Polyangiaceae bacterium]